MLPGQDAERVAVRQPEQSPSANPFVALPVGLDSCAGAILGAGDLLAESLAGCSVRDAFLPRLQTHRQSGLAPG